MRHRNRIFLEGQEAFCKSHWVHPSELATTKTLYLLTVARSICNAVNDPIPGPRPFALFDSCHFPWRKMVDSVEISGSVDSYRLSMQLSREGLVAGPASGMALKGLFHWLEKTKDAGELDMHRELRSGVVNCVFICCDLPQQYMEGYFARLSGDDFQPIQNEVP